MPDSKKPSKRRTTSKAEQKSQIDLAIQLRSKNKSWAEIKDSYGIERNKVHYYAKQAGRTEELKGVSKRVEVTPTRKNVATLTHRIGQQWGQRKITDVYRNGKDRIVYDVECSCGEVTQGLSYSKVKNTEQCQKCADVISKRDYSDIAKGTMFSFWRYDYHIEGKNGQFTCTLCKRNFVRQIPAIEKGHSRCCKGCYHTKFQDRLDAEIVSSLGELKAVREWFTPDSDAAVALSKVIMRLSKFV